LVTGILYFMASPVEPALNLFQGHSLVLYNFLEQKIQHPAELRGTFGTLGSNGDRKSESENVNPTFVKKTRCQ